MKSQSRDSRAGNSPRRYTTNEAAAIIRRKPQTLRRNLCVNGHFAGIRPFKLPGGGLLWPADEIDALASGEVA